METKSILATTKYDRATGLKKLHEKILHDKFLERISDEEITCLVATYLDLNSRKLVEFKYNIGDKVWVNVKNTLTKQIDSFEVEILSARVWRNGEIDYMFRANSYASLRAEKYCYDTEQEALANRATEFAEVDKDGAE